MPDASGQPLDDVTGVLRRLGDGDGAAFDELLAMVYDRLRQLANHHMRRERADHTLQATALVNEMYLKIRSEDRLTLEDRTHFFGIASRAMRQILVSHARRSSRDKRGGGWTRKPLHDGMPASSERTFDIIALDEALDNLARNDERSARVVELRYFGGLAHDEVARILGVTTRTVERDWAYAQVWLNRALSDRDVAD